MSATAFAERGLFTSALLGLGIRRRLFFVACALPRGNRNGRYWTMPHDLVRRVAA